MPGLPTDPKVTNDGECAPPSIGGMIGKAPRMVGRLQVGRDVVDDQRDPMTERRTTERVEHDLPRGEHGDAPTGNEGQPTFNDETRRRDTYDYSERSELVGANLQPATPSA